MPFAAFAEAFAAAQVHRRGMKELLRPAGGLLVGRQPARHAYLARCLTPDLQALKKFKFKLFPKHTIIHKYTLLYTSSPHSNLKTQVQNNSKNQFNCDLKFILSYVLKALGIAENFKLSIINDP